MTDLLPYYRLYPNSIQNIMQHLATKAMADYHNERSSILHDHKTKLDALLTEATQAAVQSPKTAQH